MTIQLHQTNETLQFSWPLGPRLLRYVLPLVVLVVWLPLVFAVSDYLRLTLMVAVATAMVPTIILLVVIAPRLSAEFSRRAAVLCRRGSQIVLGAAGPFEPQQFSVGTGHLKRWGKQTTIVTLTLRTVVIETPVELQILYEHFASAQQAQEVAMRIREFLDAAPSGPEFPSGAQ